MGISVSTASRMVDRLVAAHWVRRVPSPSNRREVAVSLTAGGHRILEHYDDLRLLAVHQCLDAVAPAVGTSLVEALRSVLPDRDG
jgi:DNA-binding MarR family transcriptional regulator